MRPTTQHPRLQPGRELKGLAHDLVAVKTLAQAAAWEVGYLEWEARWKVFLAQKSRYSTAEWEDTHKRLVRAWNMIRALLRQGQLFTFLAPTLVAASGMDTLPSTNNRLEGGMSSQARRMLSQHRGMPFLARVKHVLWWCYTHSPAPLSPARILGEMPTDETIADLYAQARTSRAHLPVVNLRFSR